MRKDLPALGIGAGHPGCGVESEVREGDRSRGVAVPAGRFRVQDKFRDTACCKSWR